MATVTCSIGQSSSLGTITPSSCSAVSGTSDEWDVTFSTSPMPAVAVGDTWNASDYSGSDYTFLFIPVGSGYRLKYVGGGWSVTSPCSVTDFMGNQASGTLNRAFSTLSSWESSLDSGDFSNLYSSGDDAVGECYDDATSFNWNVSFTGASSLGNIKLTVADGERHGGDESSGVTIAYTGTSRKTIQINRDDVTVEWLVLDFTSANNANYDGIFVENTVDVDIIVRNNILHGYDSQNDRVMGIKMGNGDSSSTQSVLNNVVYDFYQHNDHAIGIGFFDSGTKYEVYNNTVYKMISGSNNDYGLGYNNRSNHVLMKNNIAIECRNNNSSATYSKCFRNYSGTTDDDTKRNYNYSSDSTALGTNSYTSQTAANTFQSVTGAIDLSLVSDSNAVDNGIDLGTTNGVNIDVTGRDRDADTNWSIGAYQFNDPDITITADPMTSVGILGTPTVTKSTVIAADPMTSIGLLSGSSFESITVSAAAMTSIGTIIGSPSEAITISASAMVSVGLLSGNSSEAITITASPMTAVGLLNGSSTEAITVSASPMVSVSNLSGSTSEAITISASPMSSVGLLSGSATEAITVSASPMVSVGTMTGSRIGNVTVTADPMVSESTLLGAVVEQITISASPMIAVGTLTGSLIGDVTVNASPMISDALLLGTRVGGYEVLYITNARLNRSTTNCSISVSTITDAILKE